MKLVLCGAVVATELAHDPTPAQRHLESVLGTVDRQTAPFMPLTLANALDCLDLLIGSLPDTSRTILGGLMEGRTQQSIAADLGVSPSAVSQQVRNNGLGVVLEVMESLGRQP